MTEEKECTSNPPKLEDILNGSLLDIQVEALGRDDKNLSITAMREYSFR